jgi:restriction endonuclease Mrr
MNTKDKSPKALIEEVLDDTFEGLHYRLAIETELSTAEVDALINDALREMGYGDG